MKHLLFVAAFFHCLNSLKSQDTFHKLIFFDYPPSVTFRGVYPTDSCYYVVGNFTDTFPTTSGVLFAKISLSGELLLFNTLNNPGSTDEYFNTYSDLLGTPDGALLTAGGLYDTTANAQIRIFNTLGDTSLTKSFHSILYPDLSYLVVLGIRKKANGDYGILISYQSHENPYDSNISLLILDPLFQVKSYKPYANSTKYEESWSLILDDDGGYLIGARRTNDGQVNGNFTSQTLIIKTDSLGVEQWQYLSPSNKLQNAAKAMIKTPDGGLVVASDLGKEYWFNPVNPHWILWDALVYKLDADRNVEWYTPLRSYLPTSSFGVAEMVAAPDGSGYVICGPSIDSMPGQLPYNESWMVKVSNHGDSLWARHFAWFDGEFVAPDAWDMKVTPDGGYVVVGYSFNVGQHVPGWIMKVDSFGCLIPGCQTTATVEPGEPEVSLAVYPNPTSDYLNFQLRGVGFTSKAEFRIVNAEGKLVKAMKTPHPDATFTLPVLGWPVGTYFLQYLEEGLLVTTTKFIVSQ